MNRLDKVIVISNYDSQCGFSVMKDGSIMSPSNYDEYDIANNCFKDKDKNDLYNNIYAIFRDELEDIAIEKVKSQYPDYTIILCSDGEIYVR